MFRKILLLALGGLVIAGCSSKSKKASEAGVELDETQQHSVGRLMLDEMMMKYKAIEDRSALEYINKVGQYLALHAEGRADKVACFDKRQKSLPSNGFRFAIVGAPSPFSVALPSGYIVVSKGLLDQIRTEDQLAAVLSGEIHNSLCHTGQVGYLYTSKDAGQSDPSSYLKAQVNGVLTPPASAVIQSADRAAIITMTRAGYYAHNYPVLLKDMIAADGSGAYNDKRVSTARSFIGKLKVADKTTDARRARFEGFRNAVKRSIK